MPDILGFPLLSLSREKEKRVPGHGTKNKRSERLQDPVSPINIHPVARPC